MIAPPDDPSTGVVGASASAPHLHIAPSDGARLSMHAPRTVTLVPPSTGPPRPGPRCVTRESARQPAWRRSGAPASDLSGGHLPKKIGWVGT